MLTTMGIVKDFPVVLSCPVLYSSPCIVYADEAVRVHNRTDADRYSIHNSCLLHVLLCNLRKKSVHFDTL